MTNDQANILQSTENPNSEVVRPLVEFQLSDYVTTRLTWHVLSRQRWWMNHEFMKNLPYVPDTAVELYFWTLGPYFEPQYLAARVIETKFTCLISVLDNTYDAYGTFEEL
ncbi:hypothetical protein GIB67_042951 [Kingdonia uniflora]|uniref:Terpene synthase metal-binding domain-containing protein n=1 Tax=Kingdonia uniflora TaxID=39325 RepID=A0A7J7L5Y8_9MAGN|nr:hypothetical protein GIB67_042951 [Kingdonia uniflora]